MTQDSSKSTANPACAADGAPGSGSDRPPDNVRLHRPVLFAILVLIGGVIIWGYCGLWYDAYLNESAQLQVDSVISTMSGDISLTLNDRLDIVDEIEGMYLTSQLRNDTFSDIFSESAPVIMDERAQSGVITFGLLDSTSRILEYPSLAEVSESDRRSLDAITRKGHMERSVSHGTSPNLMMSDPVMFRKEIWSLVAWKSIPGITATPAYAFVVLDLDKLFSRAVTSRYPEGNQVLDIAIRTENGDILYGPPSVFSSDPVTERILLHPQMWEIGAVPRDGWRSLTMFPRVLFIFGSFAIVLLCALITYTLVDRQDQLKILVRERTNELENRNYYLKIEIEERQKAQAAANSANAKLNLLYSITRHDILNQLTALQGYLQLLLMKGDIDDKSKEYIKNGLNVADIIEEQITFTKDYEDLGVKSPQWQDVSATIKKATSGFLGIEIRISDLNGLEMYSDALLGKVFYNLAENAIRHGGYVTTIQVHCEKEGDDVVLVWSDNGIGIPDDMKEKMFERGVGKHTGLGMFLVREILAITGIVIRETGTQGFGARFEIILKKKDYRFPASSDRL